MISHRHLRSSLILVNQTLQILYSLTILILLLLFLLLDLVVKSFHHWLWLLRGWRFLLHSAPGFVDQLRMGVWVFFFTYFNLWSAVDCSIGFVLLSHSIEFELFGSELSISEISFSFVSSFKLCDWVDSWLFSIIYFALYSADLLSLDLFSYAIHHAVPQLLLTWIFLVHLLDWRTISSAEIDLAHQTANPPFDLPYRLQRRRCNFRRFPLHDRGICQPIQRITFQQRVLLWFPSCKIHFLRPRKHFITWICIFFILPRTAWNYYRFLCYHFR